MEDTKGMAKSNATPEISAVLENSRETSVWYPFPSCIVVDKEVDGGGGNESVMEALRLKLEDCRIFLSSLTNRKGRKAPLAHVKRKKRVEITHIILFISTNAVVMDWMKESYVHIQHIRKKGNVEEQLPKWRKLLSGTCVVKNETHTCGSVVGCILLLRGNMKEKQALMNHKLFIHQSIKSL